MPSISEIIDSISVPSLIKDDVIRNGIFAKSGNTQIYFTGGFTVVFPVKTHHEKWAFRCWHTEMGNVRDRFKIISDYINGLNSSYFCNFYYCDKGLVVDGKLFPTTRMKWVNGETINQYMINNAKNKEKMLSLAEKFIAMIDFLHSHHIAHGDLQHGNIIIENDELKLVDYDSLFVPGLEGESDIIIGKAEFQHPNRKQLKIASEKLDFFSELTIYISILAIAYQPTIIEEFPIDDSLLFQSSDWLDFEGSKIYKTLKAIGNKDICLLLDILISYLKESDISKLIPFTEELKILLKEPIIHNLLCGNAEGIVFRGKETEITWDAENVGRIELNSVELPRDRNSYYITFEDNADIVLVIINGLHRVEKSIHVKVIDTPKIKFLVEKRKLKRSEKRVETTYLKWSVSNARSVYVKCGEITLSTDKTSSGFKINPTEDRTYELIAVGLDGLTEFKETINVIVRNAAKFNFQSDKLFTLPGVPITVSWSTDHAKTVKLNGKKVLSNGKISFIQDSDAEYHLSVEDDFGETNKSIKVRMLPLPVVSSVLVEMPNFNQVINIKQPLPKFEQISEFPKLNLNFVSIENQGIPDLKISGLFVELPSSPKIKLTERITQFIKRIFK